MSILVNIVMSFGSKNVLFYEKKKKDKKQLNFQHSSTRGRQNQLNNSLMSEFIHIKCFTLLV